MRILQHEQWEAEGLQSAWRALSAESAEAGLFTEYDWCRCWWETLGSKSRPFIVQCLDDTGTTVGLAPLCAERPHGWLGFMGRERASGDHLDILWNDRAPPDRLALLFDHLGAAIRDFDGLLLGELDDGSPTREAAIDWAVQQGLPWREREPRRCPYVELPDEFEKLVETLSAKMRFHVRRNRRLVDRHGGAVRLISGGDSAQSALETFFDLHRRRWERDQQTGNFAAEPMQAFLRSFCAKAAERGWLRLYVLEITGHPSAVLIAFHHKNRAYFYQMGRDPDCPLESPGVALISFSIQQAIAEGLTLYDLLRGDEAYKWSWTARSMPAASLVIGRSPAARAAIHADDLKDGIKRMVCHYFGPRTWQRARRLLTRRTA